MAAVSALLEIGGIRWFLIPSTEAAAPSGLYLSRCTGRNGLLYPATTNLSVPPIKPQRQNTVLQQGRGVRVESWVTRADKNHLNISVSAEKGEVTPFLPPPGLRPSTHGVRFSFCRLFRPCARI